jgi:hypothetical protein
MNHSSPFATEPEMNNRSTAAASTDMRDASTKRGIVAAANITNEPFTVFI